MTRGQKAAIAAAVILFGVLVGGVLLTTVQPRVSKAVSLEGAVIRYDFDPRARSPIPFVTVTATSGAMSQAVKSDPSGFYRVKLTPREETGVITLKFEATGYRSLDVTVPADTGVYIAQMRPLLEEVHIEQTSAPQVLIRDVRVRYTTKTRSTVDVGVLAKPLTVFDSGGLPCRNNTTCSPDGRWKAEPGSDSYDAGTNNEFRNQRVSCIAGPCPFTKITSELLKEGRILKVSAMTWFGTATFLVEAEVVHPMIGDLIRQSYPLIFGDSMSFTLPEAGEGPSIEAELNNTDIVYPLGPNVVLPWATCSLHVDADKSRLYRCELKPGYQFQ